MALDDATTRYLRLVLRLPKGTPIEAFDGRGRSGLGIVSFDDRGRGLLDVETIVDTRSGLPQVVLWSAVPKGERADVLVEKATEIGVDEIIWIDYERSIITGKTVERRAERFQRVAQAAARQCGRSTIPTVHAAQSLSAALATWGQSARPRAFVADPGGTPSDLIERTHSTAPEQDHALPREALTVAVGPEGGMTTLELEQLGLAGFVPVSLGPYFMRVETAAIMAVGWLVQMSEGAYGTDMGDASPRLGPP